MSKYRLSLDIGTNSIGWCVLGLQNEKGGGRPCSILDMGVRIFPDGRNPKDGSSNAEARRVARAARRNRDRFVDRRNRLIEALVKFGLMPEDEKQRRALTECDPYELRARGLREELTLHQFGRAIFHLNQRRGFKSSRKSDSKDKDSGVMKDAIREQRAKMDAKHASTFGEYLYLIREEGGSVRARKKTKYTTDTKGKEKPKDYYDFFPDRELLEHEFEALWRIQEKHYPGELTKAARDRIRHIIFYQRPLKPQVVGKCTFERAEDRAPKALPIVQRIRIYQELNHLFILDTRTLKGRPLTLEERDRLLPLFCSPKGTKTGKAEIGFGKMRTVLELGDGAVFSHESEKRKGLEGDSVSALIAYRDRFGARWYELSDEDQEGIVWALLTVDDEEELIRQLMDDWGLDRKHAESVANTPLPDGYSRLGLTATRKILAELCEAVIPYSEAVVRAGYASHSQFAKGARRARLPYYGEVLERHVIPDSEKAGDPRALIEKRFGKVTNPTVHIALNQVRKVVNEIIKIHGAPAEIHVEVLRDLKNSLKKRKEIEAEQAKNQEENNDCASRLREEFKLPVNRENIQRMRLWQEMDADQRVCVYTGDTISTKNLFSPDVEIDHILPFSRTIDDSMANKVLCKRRANREKSNQTPYEAWGKTSAWEDILQRSAVLPRNKRWRFAEDAMDRYMKDADFIARQLTDSQYIARLAREYLAVLFDAKDEHKVVCLPGRLTGLFRHHLGLDDILDEINPSREASKAPRGEKNRNDHRHHAVDALLIGLMDRAFLQQAASINARFEKEGVYKFLSEFPEPWPNFHASARDALGKIIVSHKPDHGIEDALHNDTAYGFANAKRPDKRGNAVHRVEAKAIDIKNILSIKGKCLRAELVANLSGLSAAEAFKILEDLDDKKRKGADALKELCGGDEKEIGARIGTFFGERGIRRVRLIEEIRLISIRDKAGASYKGFKTDGNAYLEIYESEGGKKWEGRPVTCFKANTRRRHGDAPVQNGKKRLIRLFNRDMLEMEHEKKRRIFCIQRMSEKQIALAEHFEANADSRDRNTRKKSDKKDNIDPFVFVLKSGAEPLRKSKVRFLVVTPAGRVRYLSGEPNDDSESG